MMIIVIIIIIIMGDFNAKLCNKEYLQPVAGPYRKHGSSNENGNMLIQFAIRNRYCTKEMETFGTGNKSCGRRNHRGNKI